MPNLYIAYDCYVLVYTCNFLQEPVLFSMSVGENIAYGLPDEYVSRNDVIKAAKAANAHDFIVSLPQVCQIPKVLVVQCFLAWLSYRLNLFPGSTGL